MYDEQQCVFDRLICLQEIMFYILNGNSLMDVHITVHAPEITACDIQSQQSHYDKNIIKFFPSKDRMCMVFE